MTRFLLDTSIVSAVMWKTPDASVLEKLEEHDVTDFAFFKGLSVQNWMSDSH